MAGETIFFLLLPCKLNDLSPNWHSVVLNYTLLLLLSRIWISWEWFWLWNRGGSVAGLFPMSLVLWRRKVPERMVMNPQTSVAICAALCESQFCTIERVRENFCSSNIHGLLSRNFTRKVWHSILLSSDKWGCESPIPQGLCPLWNQPREITRVLNYQLFKLWA